MGDLNSRHTGWGCSSNNISGRRLNGFCFRENLKLIYPSEPTYYPKTRRSNPSVLDVAIIKGLSTLGAPAITRHAIDSDHNPVILNLPNQVNVKHKEMLRYQKRKLATLQIRNL